MLPDVRADHLELIRSILARLVPDREVWVFGSRAKWTARDTSDLDLCIVGSTPLGYTLLGQLHDAFAESDLPYKVDVVDWATTSDSFRKIMKKDGVVIQEKNHRDLSEHIEFIETVYGILPANLRALKLSEVCAQGGVQTGPFGSQLHKEDYTADGTPIITVEHLGDNRIIHENLPRVSDADRCRLSKYQLKTGDIVFSRVGSVDRRALVQEKENGWLFSGRCLRVRPIANIVDSQWLSYFFGLPAFKNYIRSIAVGATMPSLNTKILSDIPVYAPEIGIQRSAAQLLGSLDNRITILYETNATLESIAQALFKSWFVDFDPVHAKQQGQEPESMDSTIAALFPAKFCESALGLIPDGWRDGFLADLASLNPESWSAKNQPDTIAYIDLANVKNNQIEEISEYEFSEAPSRARRVLRQGDTIIGTVRPGNRSFAYISKSDKSLTGSTGFAVLRPKVPRNTEFIYIAATQNTSIEHLAHVADGGAYPAVRPEVVVSLKTVLPPESVLDAFHDIVGPIFAKIGENQAQAKTLATLRDTLLPRLISGQLRIPDTTDTPPSTP